MTTNPLTLLARIGPRRGLPGLWGLWFPALLVLYTETSVRLFGLPHEWWLVALAALAAYLSAVAIRRLAMSRL
ncbi:MAG TPA: hypothetical protein VGV37_26445 [Aliidongia sp.]|uniref:hypothetical protein n=1 Tax=Aliidongia sp. TaxID=1914230 RepID=UPI002DDDBD28|nr:hypothetical protein [Aliidongia sp.]HEV2678097.1 hypothetical protein [Aliidongia sp.]